ncbi:MAG: FG-GAP repeat domain-containing protein [Acidobacteriota bacterium]
MSVLLGALFGLVPAAASGAVQAVGAKQVLVYSVCSNEPRLRVRAAHEVMAGDPCVRLVARLGDKVPGNETSTAVAGTNEGDSLAPAVSGFPAKPGWPLFVPNMIPQTLAVADLGDDRGLVTIFHERDGTVHAVAADGTPFWTDRPVVSPSGVSTMPAAGDLDGDGLDEVLVAVGRLFALSTHGDILPGWPFAGGLPQRDGFSSFTPIAARLEPGDPLRVLAGSGPRGRVFALDRTGETLPGWPVIVPAGDFPSRSLVAVGDVTGDDIPEVVTIDIFNGNLLAYDPDGILLPRFPVDVPLRTEEPTLGDLDGDGAREIVFPLGFRIHVLHGDGTALPGWPQEMHTAGNFGIPMGDVDGDGTLDVAAAGINDIDQFGQSKGPVSLWHGDGTPFPGWPKLVKNVSFPAPVVIADVDGDGLGDVVAAGLTTSLFSGLDGVVYAWNATGDLIAGFPIVIRGRPIGTHAAPTITDLDGDGQADLGVMSQLGLFGLGPVAVHWFELGVPYRPEGMEWPTRAHGMNRTGSYSPPVRRQTAEIRLVPRRMNATTPAPPVLALVSVGRNHVRPQTLALAKVDGETVAPVAGERLRQGGGRFRSAGRLLFRFDGEAIRARLVAGGKHTLTFRSEAVGGLGGVLYEGEATLQVWGR